jgi:flagella basal body P-ring formation protein FlgA
MIRIATAIALLALSSVATAAQQLAALPATPSLRGDVLVAADIVRIGDLVENAGAAAGIAVFRSPDLGHTGSVAVARVTEALRAHNVIGVDTRGLTEISVTRASRAIGAKELETHIARILAARYGLRDADNLSVTFDRDVRAVHVDPTAGLDLPVTRASFEPRSGRFDVVLQAGTGSAAQGARPALRLTGIAVETQEAVVVLRPISRGEALRESDIAIERRPKTEMSGDVLRDPEAAIGFAVRQSLPAGQIIRRTDLTKPELVHRNEPVIMMFEQPGVVLTLRGKALESGAEGDTVNVVNLQSKKTLQGVVTAPGQVTIVSLTPRATTNLAAMPHPGAMARP